MARQGEISEAQKRETAARQELDDALGGNGAFMPTIARERIIWAIERLIEAKISNRGHG